MLRKMCCFTLQSVSCTNLKFPVYATRNVQTQLKSTVDHHAVMQYITAIKLGLQWNLLIRTLSGPAILSFTERLSSFRGDFL